MCAILLPIGKPPCPDSSAEDGGPEVAIELRVLLPRFEESRVFPYDFTARVTGEVFEGLHHLNTSHQAEPDRVAATLTGVWERAERAPS